MDFIMRYFVFAALTTSLVFIPATKWNTHLKHIFVGYFLTSGLIFMI